MDRCDATTNLSQAQRQTGGALSEGSDLSVIDPNIARTTPRVTTPRPNLGLANALRLSPLGCSRMLARALGRGGITASIVLPVRVATDRIEFLVEQKAVRENWPVKDVRAQSVDSIRLDRFSKPQEFAVVVCFTAAARASHISGSVICADGGLIARS